MNDPKLSKACPVEDAIRYLRIPDDAGPYVVQLGNYDPGFPRRHAFGQINVVPLQLARFLIDIGVGYLLEDGPCAYLLEEDADDGADDEGDDEDQPQDDAEEDEPEESEDDDERPPRRAARRRR